MSPASADYAESFGGMQYIIINPQMQPWGGNVTPSKVVCNVLSNFYRQITVIF